VGELTQHLTRQRDAARQLLTALQVEAQQLQTLEDSDVLHASTREKLACVRVLEAAVAAFHEMRNQVLPVMGYSADEAGWGQALHAHPDWAHEFQTLQALLEEARQLNAQNGMALQTCLRHTRHALLDLSQHAGGSLTGSLYTASGRILKSSTPAVLPRTILAG